MDRRISIVLAAGILMAILLVSVSSAGEVHLWHEAPPSTPTRITSPEVTISTATTPSIPEGEPSDTELPAWIRVVVAVVLILVAAGVIAFLVLAAWRHRPQLSWRRRVVADDFDVLPDIASSMAADAADQRAALLRGAPRNAIVECWLRLERVVAEAGLQRDPADTSTEFTQRVLASYAVEPRAILDLSALYREARFSTHDMGEDERDAAVAALDALHDGFRAHVRRLEAEAERESHERMVRT